MNVIIAHSDKKEEEIISSFEKKLSRSPNFYTSPAPAS
jgi:hypothetical protein